MAGLVIFDTHGSTAGEYLFVFFEEEAFNAIEDLISDFDNIDSDEVSDELCKAINELISKPDIHINRFYLLDFDYIDMDRLKDVTRTWMVPSKKFFQ